MKINLVFSLFSCHRARVVRPIPNPGGLPAFSPPPPIQNLMKFVTPILCGAVLLAAGIRTLRAADAANPYAPLAYKPLCNLGQALADVEVAKHKELKILTLHVTPLGSPVEGDGNRHLFFGNIGRIGKVDDADDDKAFRTGQEVVEVQDKPAPPSLNFSITATPKYEVLGILKTKDGTNIGLCVMVFPYHKDFDLETYHKIAQTVCDELSSRIDSKDSLFAPAP